MPGALGLAPTWAQGRTKDMGMSIPHCLGQLDIRKGIVGLATGAGFIYLLYKAIKAGIKCQPPLCTTSPICIARECTGPGERARPQEAPAPEVSSVGGPKGDSSQFLSPSFSLPSSQTRPRDASSESPGSRWLSSGFQDTHLAGLQI